MEKSSIERVNQIYHSVLSSLDDVLIGQTNVKKAIAASILCDLNSRILLIGNTGTGKTTLSNYLASSFKSERISITSDMLPSDVQNQLKEQNDLEFLQLDEFNRASGKVLSAFIELFAEKQLSVAGERYNFHDFYVFATQNSADISGTFNIPQAVYDRFDISVYFESLTESEKRQLFFNNFEPPIKSDINENDLRFAKATVDEFKTGKSDEDLMMKIFGLIDEMKINGKKLFAGSNIRAHRYALKMAKLAALSNERNYILSSDITTFLNYIYMHRIDQNVAIIGEENVLSIFEDVQKKIRAVKRKKTI